ncbi:MAG: SBBP repeat-containing protein [Acidobacteriota bacterium]|nr:SBBP repeat-containing protein [Acidobacteriota bacterium]
MIRTQIFGAALLVALSCASLDAGPLTPATDKAAMRLIESFGKSEASFEQNVGQAPAETGFLGRGLNYSLSLNGRGAVLATQRAGRVNRAVELVLENSSQAATGAGVNRLPIHTGYMLGNNPSKWLTDVPSFEKVRYSEVWPGVDAVYYGTHNQLEYDLIVHPGADTHAIHLQFRGVKGIRLNSAGDLVLDTQFGELLQHQPRIYQKIGEKTRDVAGRYVIGADQSVTVEVSAYDKSSDLIIDPVLLFAKILDATFRSGNGVVTDSSGNSYYTGSANSELTPGVFQTVGFISKLDPAGNLNGLSSITFGGATGPSVANALAVDSSGNIYATGSTSATDFPTSIRGFQQALAEPGPNSATDAFLIKVNPGLNALLYGTYIGGQGNDAGNAIALDASSNVYIAGQTSAANFPKTVGQPFRANGTTGFAIEINTNASTAAASKVWATFLGGSGTDFGRAITVDAGGNATVGGATTSADFLPTSGTGFSPTKTTGIAQDGFLVTLNPSGTAASYFTYFPFAPINGIAGVAPLVYATGVTNGNIVTTATGFQLSGGAGHAFLAKFNTVAGGTSSLLYSSYLGGVSSDVGKGVAADSSGNASVGGQTSSPNFPTTAGAVPLPSGSAPPDGFVTTINTNASGQSGLVFSTLLGGSASESANGVALDNSGNLFAAGTTMSSNFIVPNSGGTALAFALKFGSSSGTVSPSSGSGSSQAFTFTYTDPNGYQDISGSQIIINSTTSGAGACYILFGRGSNAIALANDAGTPGPLTTLGAPTVLQNSQCSVLASISSQSFSGNTVTLTLFVVFKPSFAGAKNVYTAFSTNGGVSSGLQQVGTFTATVNTTPISAVSVTPASGSGQAQSFTFNYFDPNGYPNTSGSQVLFNATTSSIGACYILFGRGTNQISLGDDSGSNFTTAPLGGQTVLQNSQCSVFAANSFQSGSGTNLFLTLFVAFKPAFAGAKNVYSGSTDNGGNRSAFIQLGTWTVPATPPALAVNSVTPSAATGPSNPLTFVFSDPNGFGDISGGQVVVNPTLSTGAGSCNIQFARSGLIALVGDDGVSTTTAMLGQPTFLQNSQCIVNAAASYQAGSGNYLSLTLFVTMKTAGAKNVYASVSSNSSATSGFSQVGTWNVTSPSALTPVSVSPGTGAGTSGTPQFFTFTYSDPNGASDISGSQIIINPALQGAFARYVLYGRGTNLVAIANDTATVFTNGTMGTAGTLQNSQCSIDLSKSFQVQTGNTVNLTLAVNFAPGYKGLMYAFSNVVDNAGNTSSFPALGAFLVQ